ncbi:hypothetical protein QN379_20215 [Glaciimonas sp. Gout2]|uniref:hypothetical protein n=1 Tax=unclassified Glaciimonas TaxID=2644401 RepID=UPI002AB4C6AB|nr:MULTISPECIES: hypothetical protein [unclassified Glaciimonas]MDY7547612.1 hypothetical protein [Glaciimonas sp. CA11.2]MEB0014380.1 hypothetical protein [Glaciimonas sp. Cout2]MEB0084338.1 hypothetical protein [Glaciimonas sp. Gout2]
MGEDVTEQLDVEPARFFLNRHLRLQYARLRDDHRSSNSCGHHRRWLRGSRLAYLGDGAKICRPLPLYLMARSVTAKACRLPVPPSLTGSVATASHFNH